MLDPSAPLVNLLGMTRHSSPFVNPQRALLPMLCLCTAAFCAELPEEKPLWPVAGFENPVCYGVKETVKPNRASNASLSGSNRVFSFVAEPTYGIHQAPKAQATGVGLVICPGGGYRDVWLDREGHDLAWWLKGKGITSLVLKYRTNDGGQGDDRKYLWDVYLPAVFADARQAIRILRSQAAHPNPPRPRHGLCHRAEYSVFVLALSMDWRGKTSSSPGLKGGTERGQTEIGDLHFE
jgi:hypothetical protein